MASQLNNKLRQIYFDPANPGSFGGIQKLYRNAKIFNPNLTIKSTKDFLSGEFPYSLHRNKRRKFTRNRIYVSRIDENWQIDLVDLTQFAASNNGHKYLLTAIDLLSKYAWARPLRSKSGPAVTKAFQSILEEGRVPEKLQSDMGTEFLNAHFKRLLKKYDIHYFTTRNFTVKCSVLERFHRTLKNRMFRFFSYSANDRYIDKLQDFIDSYNQSYHRSIKMRPCDVNPLNSSQVLQTLYGQETVNFRSLKKPKLDTGDQVRKQLKKQPFQRGYDPQWTDAIYYVDKIYDKPIPMYQLRDEAGNPLRQRYYEPELQKIRVDDNSLYRIERILDTRRRRGRREVYVKWLGYSNVYNQWIPESYLTRAL